MNTKLIIVTGMSGAGKSTMARNLAEQYRQNEIRYRWLHEEIRNHPIRNGEFTRGSLYSATDMERNIHDMFQRWERLVRRILRSKSVNILEAVLFENIMRYFFIGNYPPEKITTYYDRLLEIMEPANPVIVFLYRSDVRATLEAMYEVRGDWWKKLILDAGNYAYFRDHALEGEEGVYAMWEAYQALGDAAFQRSSSNKIKIDTTAGEWNIYIERLVSFLGLAYHAPEAIEIANPLQYCGRYTVQVAGQTHAIEIRFDGVSLYCQAFWPYMQLLPLGRNRFAFSAFPVKLDFRKDSSGCVRAVKVSGSYDWDIMGTIMAKVV